MMTESWLPALLLLAALFPVTHWRHRHTAVAVALAAPLLSVLLMPYHGARAEAAAPAIQVSVMLAATLQEQVKPDDTLFVYARAPTGPRMPLAIARLRAADLPVTVTLDDDSAMMPAMKLSAFDEVMIMARISRSGDAMTRSGDLVGSSGPVRVRATPLVEVRIEEQVP